MIVSKQCTVCLVDIQYVTKFCMRQHCQIDFGVLSLVGRSNLLSEYLQYWSQDE